MSCDSFFLLVIFILVAGIIAILWYGVKRSRSAPAPAAQLPEDEQAAAARRISANAAAAASRLPPSVRQAPPPLPSRAASVPAWFTDTEFRLKVTGTSYYLPAFEALFGPRSEEGEDRTEWAHLVLDDANPYDRNAVRVEIRGHRIGHLEKQAAADFRARLARENLPIQPYPCRAHIVGGWYRDKYDEGGYGVRLAVALYD